MRSSRSSRVERAGAVSRLFVLCVAAAAFAAPAVRPLAAQQPDRSARDTTSRGDTLVYLFSPLAVTATRTAKELFVTPAPVSIFTLTEIREARPNTVADLFRDAPGLDVTGVGAQQPRPVIRGQRGQRILLLQDGLRLNNARRQQDFGEIPALVDVASVERVEVVRGPASVLYGTDAIGGVVNIITRSPAREGFHGIAGYRFGSAAGTHKGSASMFGRFGALDVSADVAVREA
ncbi:MAG: TonB-dependent receptor plug domain-containing protein, partial [Longimicrobiales bacterium]